MKRWFAALPVHRKLVTLALAVSSVAVVAALLAVAAVDVWRFRAAAAADTASLAALLARNVAAAVEFADQEDAAGTLTTVLGREEIVRACVYLADGALFAAAATGPDACPPDQPDATPFDHLAARSEVLGNGRTIGWVYVEQTLAGLRQRLVVAAGTGLAVLLVVGVLAVWLANALQRSVSRPIVALAAAARRFDAAAGQALPDVQAPPDEVGDLVRAFADMVARVREANDRLVASNAALRLEVVERRRMEAERELLLERERAASRLKDEFLAAVSHELRTPLNAVLGWAQVLAATPPDPATLERALAAIGRNARAQARVIDDLIDVSRIVTGKLQLRKEGLDLRATIDTAVEAVRPLSRDKGLTLQVDLPRQPVAVFGDPDRLQQVTWNLLTNAVKFTPPGGRVTVTLRTEPEAAAIEVRDTGAGIAPAFLPLVFERFRQADGSMTREHGGLGLGLAIVRELTDLHGGTVAAASDGPGTGATFTIRLPRPAADRAAAHPEPSAHPPAPATAPLAGLRVVAVDDNPDALDVLGAALARAGATVRVAASGDEAVRAWREQPGDVLVCDLAMPRMDGFECLRRIRALDAERGRLTRAVAVTAHASGDHRAKALRAGFRHHVAKPFETDALVRAISAASAQE